VPVFSHLVDENAGYRRRISFLLKGNFLRKTFFISYKLIKPPLLSVGFLVGLFTGRLSSKINFLKFKIFTPMLSFSNFHNFGTLPRTLISS